MTPQEIQERKLALTSEKKHQNIENHRKKNCTFGSLKMDLAEIENEKFSVYDCRIDDDYQGFLMDGGKKGTFDDLQVARNEDTNHDLPGGNDTQENDPQYDIFLNSIQPLGNSWVVHADERNRLPACFVLEDGSNDDLYQHAEEMKSTRGLNVEDVRSDSSRPEVFGSLHKKRRTMVENAMKFDSSDPIVPNDFEVEQCLDEVRPSASSYAFDRQCNIDPEECDSQIERTSEKVTKEANLEAAISLDFDSDYESFLKDFEVDEEGGVMKQKSFSSATQVNSDLQNLQQENSGCSKKGNPNFATSSGGSDAAEDDSCGCLGSPSSESDSLFREQVMRILRKPYDRKEHQTLSGDMKYRKPVVRSKDLRFGREQSFETNKEGKSFIDHYPDLKRKLEAATCRKELNLLRGFFFWLQHLTREGAFRPWQDKACLDVLPPNP